MTRSTVNKMEEPLDEPERELHRRRKAASHQQRNKSLAIAGRNLFDEEPSSIINTKTIEWKTRETTTSSTTFVEVVTKLMNVIKTGYLNKCACPEGTFMTTPPSQDSIRTMISYRKGTYDEGQKEKKVMSGSLEASLRIGYLTLCWKKTSMHEKDLHAKGLGEMLNQHRSGMHEQFSKILATIRKIQTLKPKPDAPTFAIKTRSGSTTHDPPYLTLPSLTTVDNTERTIVEEGSDGEETTTTQSKETHQSPTIYHPFRLSSVPFPSRLKKQKKDDDDEWLLSSLKHK
ncbi:hypothetical protein Tco_1175295 [Tanacetum coccineum]